MTIHAASKHLYQLLIAIGFISVLAACGGGSSGPKKDSTPNAFTLASVTNAKVSTEVTSAPITLSGFNQSVSISISGGSYSVAGTDFKTAAGTVTNGQVVTVKLTSSDKTNTSVTATLTVGGVSGTFTVTTEPDVTPDTFTFTSVIDAGSKVVTPSDEITVKGVDVAVPISVAAETGVSAEYSVDGGAFTTTAGTVNKDQKVIVRATSSDKPSTPVTTVLTIGGVSANFVVTTKADEAAPTAQILFPPPVSMTEGNTILVRGSASDEFSAIASVKVNGVAVTPKAAGDFSSWQVSVPLTEISDNDVVVTTKDSVGNESTNAAKVMVKQNAYITGFPDNKQLFSDPSGLAIDKLDGRDRLLVADASRGKIVSIDLATGNQTLFTNVVGAPDQIAAIVIDSLNKKLFGPSLSGGIVAYDLADPSKSIVEATSLYTTAASAAIDIDTETKVITVDDDTGAVVSFDTTSKQFTLLSDASLSVPDAINPISSAQSIVIDKKNNRYIVLSGGWSEPDASKHGVYAVNKATGARTVLSSNAVGAGELFSGLLSNNDIAALGCMAIDEVNNRLVVPEAYTGKIFSVDLNTGSRSLIFKAQENSSVTRYAIAPQSMVIHPSNNYAFLGNYQPLGIYAIDLVTGEQVIVSN